MAEEDFATLDGEAQSWANITVTFKVQGGASLKDVQMKSCVWAVDREIGEQKSKSGATKKRTRGNAKITGTVGLYADGHEQFMEALSEAAEAGGFIENGILQLGLVPFDCVIQHRMKGEDDRPPKKVELLGCFIMKDSGDHKEGVEPDSNEIPMSIGAVVRTLQNGKRVALL